MSKSPDGRPFGPKITLAGIGFALILTPIDFSSCVTIAFDVVRGPFPIVHDQLPTAGTPPHVQPADVLGSTRAGPPVQSFLRTASAFAGLKLNFATSSLCCDCVE